MFVGILAAIGAAAFVSALGSSRFSVVSIIFQNPTQMLAILGAALLIVLIGVADDIWDLDWTTKLAGQFIAAGLIAWQGVSIVSLPIGGITVGSSWMSATITVFTIVLVMNAINFIDRPRRPRRGRRPHRERRVLPLHVPPRPERRRRSTTSTSRRCSRSSWSVRAPGSCR
jgi:hypothetical protein